MIRAIVMQPNANASLKGKIVNVVGTGSRGFGGDGGFYANAELSEPRAVAFDDTNNNGFHDFTYDYEILNRTTTTYCYRRLPYGREQ